MTKLKIGMLILEGFLQHFIVVKSSSDKRLSYILGVKHENFLRFIIKCNINLTILVSKDVFLLFMKEFISRLWTK